MKNKTNDNYLKKELYELIKTDDTIFDFIQESSVDGLWYWDLDNPENEWMNNKFWLTLGYDPNEMPHKSSAWQDIINQEDLKLALDNFKEHSVNPNHPYDQNVRYTHKNGSVVWIRCRGMAIRDENGKPLRMLGAHQDITAIKENEIEFEKQGKQLNERIKELNGLYSLGLLSEKYEELTKIYPEFVEKIVPLSMQFPEKVYALLIIDNIKYTNRKNYKLPEEREYLSASIKENEKVIGDLIVSYTEDLPFIDEFENKLISAFAERISKITKRVNTEHELKKQIKEFASLNEEYVTINEEYLTINEELHKAQKIIVEREERIRQIGDNIPKGMIFQLLVQSDGKSRFIYLSKKVEDMHECTAEEVMADSSLMFSRVLSDDLPSLQKATEVSIREMSVFDLIVRIKRKSGKIRWHRMISKPRKLKNGDILFDGIDFDITETKNAEEALKESEAELDFILNSFTEPVYNIKNDYKIKFANKATIEKFGEISYSEPCYKTLHGNDEKCEWCVFSSLTHEKPIINYDFHFPKDNTHKTITNILMHNDSKLIIYSDITNLKKAEAILKKSTIKLKEANAAKDKFFSIIAHDLKSPFGTILGFSEILIEKFDRYGVEKQKEFIKYIYDGIKKTYKLLDNLLIWSRSQKGNIDYHPENMNLYLTTYDTIELLNQSAVSKSVKINNQIPENIYIGVDKDMFLTIIRNLLSNAIKFTPKGGDIFIMAQRIKQFTEITIKDTGVGISKEMQNKLFDISNNTITKGTNDETGTGLGLIICKEFVKKHRGEIRIESEPNEGSSFIFTVPYEIKF